MSVSADTDQMLIAAWVRQIHAIELGERMCQESELKVVGTMFPGA